jgi:hypothetical protein
MFAMAFRGATVLMWPAMRPRCRVTRDEAGEYTVVVTVHARSNCTCSATAVGFLKQSYLVVTAIVTIIRRQTIAAVKVPIFYPAVCGTGGLLFTTGLSRGTDRGKLSEILSIAQFIA